jgi:hypothetical protein
MDGKGKLHEQVYDVLCSDDRPINAQYRCEIFGRIFGKKSSYLLFVSSVLAHELMAATAQLEFKLDHQMWSVSWHSQQACSEASTVESNTLSDILQY